MSRRLTVVAPDARPKRITQPYADEAVGRLHRAAQAADRAGCPQEARLFSATAAAVMSLTCSEPSTTAECWRWTPVVQGVLVLAEDWL